MFVFNPFVFSFDFIKLSLLKIIFLDSLKVKMIFLHVAQYRVSLVLGICRLNLITGKFSRLLQLGLEKGREQKFLSASCVQGQVLSRLLFHDPYFT